MVGNDFLVPRSRLGLTTPANTEEAALQSITPIITSTEEIIPVTVATPATAVVPIPVIPTKQRNWNLGQPLDALYRHSFVVFTLLFLLVGASGIEVGGRYWAARLEPPVVATAKKPTISGMSITVPVGQLQQKLQQITGQPASLTVGDQTVPVSPDTIKSWLQITADNAKTEDFIFVNKAAMSKSLSDMADKFVRSPVNQVIINHGGADQVIVYGHNGAHLTDPGTLATQAGQFAKTVMDAKGMQFSTPLQTQAYSVVTPAAFGKLLEADVTTKTLYVYQNGQLINTFLTSDGAPATPTPLGEYHIYAKYAVQDMKGFNANGTKYFQPRVPWVNYFTGGDAIHGVYWHPSWWFGAINSSHGCVGVPVDVGEWIYNWAPVGTTVITHT
ncbi:MAG TPA: L,D-transpeptidase [Candidatus Saccharimonadia bacterium]|nr:L,D-transpeptidase [Candidatus Saccharimonadia bacterium]